MKDCIKIYAYDLTSKDKVAKRLLNVSVKYTTTFNDVFLGSSEGVITITSLEYRITIFKIMFLEGDFIDSRVLDKTLRFNESLSVEREFFSVLFDGALEDFLSGFDRMIIVTDKGDFLFCCDEQTKQER